MVSKPLNEKELLLEIEQFRDSFSVALLATSDADGSPEASNAPFIRDQEGNFFIFVSMLARHTRNIMDRPKVSFLLLESDQNSPNPFALRRLQYQCTARVIENRDETIDLLRTKFGKFIDTLNALGDFRLICLSPVTGKYVKGFAQTFTLAGEELNEIDHVNPGKG